jgi:hypothetical protein
MDELAAPVLAHQRLAEVKERLEELATIAKRSELLASLSARWPWRPRTPRTQGALEQKIRYVADRVAVLQHAASLDGCLQN